MGRTVQLKLPMPPSLNAYYRAVNGKVLISQAGRNYRKEVATYCLMNRVKKLEGRLFLSVGVVPPDRRRRDLDNTLKAIQDSLQKAGVYDDDSQIDELWVSRKAHDAGDPHVYIRIEEKDDA